MAASTAAQELRWAVVGPAVLGAVVTPLAAWSPGAADELATAISGASAIVGCLVAVLIWGSWRRTGSARVVRLGTCVALLALAAPLGAVPGARPALLLVAAGWAVRAFGTHEVDSELRPVVDATTAAVIAAAAVAVARIPAGTSGDGPWLVLAALAWLGALVAASRDASPWPSAPLAARLLVGASALSAAARALPTVPTLSADVLQLAGLVAAVLGVTSALTACRTRPVATGRDGSGSAGDAPGAPADAAAAYAAPLDVHEVRNALLAVDGATALLEHAGERLSAAQRRQLVTDLRAGIDHLRALLDGNGTSPVVRGGGATAVPDLRPSPTADDLRALARSVTTAPQLQAATFPRTAAADALELCRERASLARARGVPVRVAAGGPCPVAAPARTVRQIVDNLIINAERHGHARARGVTLRVQLRGGEVVIHVDDHGPGVPWRARPAVLAAGHRGAGRSGVVAGSGLGLHQVARSVGELGGGLALRDAAGGGLSVAVRLPAVGAADLAAAS